MKRLLFLFLLTFSVNAQASVFVPPDISADAAPTAVGNAFDDVADIINGNIEGSSNGTSVVNIKADSVYEINMADDANPRVRDSELLNITVDTISGGAINTQGTVVESGCVPATSGSLTSDVSACTVYVNGYRVTKAATSQTYADNSTTYLWLSQTGVYTQSTNPNTSIANSSLLASVTTSGGSITTVSTLFTSRTPGLIIPSNYRDYMQLSRDSTTTMTLAPGSVEINNTIVTKTANTTLDITSTSNWAGGASLQATNTFGYVGIDTSGNVKMHTTAPAFSNYAVSTTAGKKRYSTWSGTVYRILGWFRMNGTGSGELDDWGVSNIKEAGLSNTVLKRISTDATTTAAAYESMGSSTAQTIIPFYSSGGKISSLFQGAIDTVGAGNACRVGILRDGVIQNATSVGGASGQDGPAVVADMSHDFQGTKSIEVMWHRSAGADTMTQLGGSGAPRTLEVGEE